MIEAENWKTTRMFLNIDLFDPLLKDFLREFHFAYIVTLNILYLYLNHSLSPFKGIFKDIYVISVKSGNRTFY